MEWDTSQLFSQESAFCYCCSQPLIWNQFFFNFFFLVGSLENWNFPLGLDGVDSHEAFAKLWIVAKKGVVLETLEEALIVQTHVDLYYYFYF